MTEYGPYIYREKDIYSEPEAWDVPTPVPGKPSETKAGIRMIMNQTSDLDLPSLSKMDADIDTRMWQINQAAQGVWYAATNTPDWRIYLNVSFIYSS